MNESDDEVKKEKRENDEDSVKTYLCRMLAGAKSLATESMHDDDIQMKDVEDLLDSLAQTLLQVACVLHYNSLQGLPVAPPEPVQSKYDPIDEDLHERAYSFRRVDYLRRLLRALAPVAMEVAARIMEDASIESFVILAFWLPIAPQLMHGIADHVESGRCPFPFSNDRMETTENEAVLPLLLEAAYHLVHEFWYTHRQPLHQPAWQWSRVTRYQTHAPWFARRILAHVFETMTESFLIKHKADFPFSGLHPWDYQEEEVEYDRLLEKQQTRIFWNEKAFALPLPEQVYNVLKHSHERLFHLHHGFVFWKHASVASSPAAPPLIMTPTTHENMLQLAIQLCNFHRPMLLYGEGSSFLIRHTARQLGVPLLELYLDETTDAATLLGTTIVTETQQFRVQPGAITKAVTAGHWLLLHHVDTVMDLQALLEPLFEHGTLQRRRAHRNFRCFAVAGQEQKVLHPQHFSSLRLTPLPRAEIFPLARALYPELPESIMEAIRTIVETSDDSRNGTATRHVLKLVQRLARVCPPQHNDTNTYITERDRLLCVAESMDCLVHMWSDRDARLSWVQSVAAPAFGVAAPTARQFVAQRTTMERVKDVFLTTETSTTESSSSIFANIPSSMRLLESLAVAVHQNEPVLLVGETGVGKTTIVQQLAQHMSGVELIVQNVSLQTDSTDLLGGYRPLELRQVARRVYQTFVDVFTGTFSRQQNADFLRFAASSYQNEDWKKLSTCFRRAAGLGMKKLQERQGPVAEWQNFAQAADRFERQRTSSGPLFAFTEGALVDAIRTGKWVLLDEINLASSETLQRLTGLLGNNSLTLTERGDSVALERHPSFRLFAAMNPATDTGKKELARGIRSKFTELYVDELLDPVELRDVVSSYMSSVLPVHDSNYTLQLVVELYLKFRELADRSFVDGSGQRPRYTLRTLTRAVTATCKLVSDQKYSVHRALYESFQLAFQGPLDSKSFAEFDKALTKKVAKHFDKAQQDKPGRRPGGRQGSNDYHLIKPFWIRAGPLTSVDWAHEGNNRFVLVPSTLLNLRRLARAVASGPWPVLLEGPTSAGKTSLVEYVAARCGHNVVRINNHEHTDVQEYTGAYAADANGSLVFQDGILVSALRQGHWVILDELNLAPSDVLEALNRLLDDNRELYIAETNETVRPHPNFRLFATQNPSGSYGGRKPLSRAFRNRFVEIQVNDIPSSEMAMILEKRCSCPPSHAQLLVGVMTSLRQKRSRSGVFLGNAGFITPRDLLRWAERGSATKRDLAHEGYMLLAERLRSEEEKDFVKEEIERNFELKIDTEEFYYGTASVGRGLLDKINDTLNDHTFSQVAPTKSLLRVLTLLHRCLANREPVLLVGETGCGKTMAVQLLSALQESNLTILNCHQTTETSDVIGGLRPVRGRGIYRKRLLDMITELSHRTEELASLEIDSDTVSDDVLGSIVKEIRGSREKILSQQSRTQEPRRKSRKLGATSPTSLSPKMTTQCLLDEIGDQHAKYIALFEWEDGPLVKAMKYGDTILLDEMSLAEDAVLERLNSVLENARTIVLAEKSCTAEDSRVVVADSSFQLFATMNPGGDFGKRELSPALRSRFTEIWVPPVNDLHDIELVLQKSFAQANHISERSKLTNRMIEYVEWFNETSRVGYSGAFSGLSLSLRDLLSWSSFIIASMHKCSLGLWDAYVHGAQLMHLDGLGLGTGVTKDYALSVAENSRGFLSGQINQDGAAARLDFANKVASCGDRFSVGPFWISKGDKEVHADVPFMFSAPTPSSNMRRVLRSLQLKKPVLLEGSPGCGKTSLVESLARATGHDLVRMNLSEQTDMADLMGSDIPVHDDDSSCTIFKWVDGALLSAIKAGSWVLLDELNLASQSVLEGLNSCLDHRAEVYVPELGKTFVCPESFRVFAAQNPLLQGGGRKGLPKSFLNRFTKVHIESLCDLDYKQIIRSRFPGIEAANKIVEFNKMIHTAASEAVSFGRDGAPFEFNLRDMLRWCQLVSSSSQARDFESASLLYIQRFRRESDRRFAESVFVRVFGPIPVCEKQQALGATEQCVMIGGVTIPKLKTRPVPVTWDCSPEVSHLEPLTSIARCVESNWPVLLVGDCESKCSNLPVVLSSMIDSYLLEVEMCPSTDVSELIGSFEQIDSEARYHQLGSVLVEKVKRLLDECAAESEEELVASGLERFLLDTCVTDVGQGINMALEFISALVRSFPHFWDSGGAMLEKSYRALQSIHDSHASFSWKDGPLVEAMKLGHWLHLRNVNLCASAVLDRLNPVLEAGGSLHLAEVGLNQVQTEKSSPGQMEIRPHANFRVFLSMDPKNGEVSRAMRNRCVEIFVLPERENTFVDHNIATSSQPNACNVGLLTTRAQNTLALASKRGISITGKTSNEHQSLVPPKSRIQQGWGSSPRISTVSDQSRLLALLRPLLEHQSDRTSLLDWIPYHRTIGQSSSFFTLLPQLEQIPLGSFRTQLLVACLTGFSPSERQCLLQLTALQQNSLHASIRFLHSRLQDLVETPCTKDWDAIDAIQHLERHLAHELSRVACLSRLHLTRSSTTTSYGSVVEASFFVSEGSLNSSLDLAKTSPLLPFIYPLLREFEDINVRLTRGVFLAKNEDSSLVQSLILFYQDMDDFWDFVDRTELGLGTRNRESNTILRLALTIQWRRCQNSLFDLHSVVGESMSEVEYLRLNPLKDLLAAGEKALIGFGGADRLIPSIREHLPRPLVPRSSQDWNTHMHLLRLSQSLCVDRHHSNQSVWGLENVLNRQETQSFATIGMKRDILCALSTLQLSGLSEAVPVPISHEIPNKIERSLRQHQLTLNAQIALLNPPTGLPENADEAWNNSNFNEQTSAIRDTTKELLMFKHALLNHMANLQISPAAEFWCEQNEIKIIALLCSFLQGRCSSDGICRLKTSISELIEVGLSHSQWSVTDISPYQAIMWLLDHDGGKSRAVLKSLLQILRCNMSKRNWLTIRDLFQSFSMQLAIPFFSDGRECGATVPVSLGAGIIDTTIFRIVGRDHRYSPSTCPDLAVTTIENHDARENQIKRLFSLVSKHNYSSELVSLAIAELSYAFTELMDAMDKTHCFDGYIWALEEDAIASVFRASLEPDVIADLVLPFHRSMKILASDSSTMIQNSDPFAKANILLGLLQFHFCLPDSCEDPGSQPLGAIFLAEHQIESLASELAALEVQHSHNFGIRGCRTARATQIIKRCHNLKVTQETSKEKVVYRPSKSPSFSDLYDAVCNFAASHMEVKSVLILLETLSGSRDTTSLASIKHAENWKKTVDLFCDHLLREYGVYGDIVMPLVASLGRIVKGFAHFTTSNQHMADSIYSGCTRILTEFPQEMQVCTQLNSLHESCELSAVNTETIGFSALQSELLRRSVVGLDKRSLVTWRNVVGWLLDQKKLESSLTMETPVASLEYEDDLKSQFPDHYTDFFTPDQESGADETTTKTNNPPSDFPAQKYSATFFEKFCLLHSSMFEDKRTPVANTDRLHVFRTNYDAARQLHFANAADLDGETSVSPGHAMALALSASAVVFLGDTIAEPEIRDFHKDPSPQLALEASVPLTNLYARASALLTLFPGNTILVAIAKVIDKVVKLDLHKVPIGKYMTGLEVILRHSQDWEQHVSKRVSLGDALVGVKRLAGSWRKLEMNSWRHLIKGREDRMLQEGYVHWGRLQSIFHQLDDHMMDIGQEIVPTSSVPSWVWRGYSFAYPELRLTGNGVRDIIDTIDCFCRTASIGGIEARLDTLRAFVRQIEAESLFLGCNPVRLQLGRCLSSMVNYYSQFTAHLREARKNSRKTFLEQLEQETKLAKWDDQTYYAALEANDRNHRKVMNILRTYDQTLQRNVSRFYEEEICRGIRPNLTSKSEVLCKTPSNQSMFPLLETIGHEVTTERGKIARKAPDTLEVCNFFGPSPPISQEFPRLQRTNLEKYVGKMAKLGAHQMADFSGLGEQSARMFRSTIIERLASLRSPKASRPMKERALTDLMRKLKHEGFYTTKLHLPQELNSPSALFEAPSPDYLFIDPKSNAELYFQRCLAETISFQREVDTLGSEFMTKAQLDAMTSVAKHGLFVLIQQRCALHSAVHHIRHQAAIQGEFAKMAMPSFYQEQVQKSISSFREKYLLAEESLNQQVVYLEKCQLMHDSQSRTTFTEPTIEKLKNFVFHLKTDTYKPMACDELKCENDVEQVMLDSVVLDRIKESLDDAREQLLINECLPLTSFDNCSASVERAILSSRELRQIVSTSPRPIDANAGDFMASASGVVEVALLTAQVLTKEVSEKTEEEDMLLAMHRAATGKVVSSNISKLSLLTSGMKTELVSLFKGPKPSRMEAKYGSVAVDVSRLLYASTGLLTGKVSDYYNFHVEILKLQYVLVRIFRVLASTGFCSGSEAESGKDDTAGMEFEDVDGTGMGEGEGKKDVTDELENEEQLLGLAEGEKDDTTESQNKESKQLDEEEAETGMEMDTDFGGELFDVPDNKEDNPDDEGEELEREIGDGSDPLDQVLDEKLWDESDVEDENGAPEGIEDGSEVKGKENSEEMTTKEDSTEDNDSNQEEDKPAGQSQNDETAPPGSDEEDFINDEDFEENNGVDVQGGSNEENPDEGAEPMDLDDDMSIDGNESEAKEDEAELVENMAMPAALVLDEDLPDEPNSEDGTPQEDETAADNNQEDSSNSDDNENDDKAVIEMEGLEDDVEANDPPDEMRASDPPERTESYRGLGVHDKAGNDAIDGNGHGQDTAEREDDATAGQNESQGDDSSPTYMAEEPSSAGAANGEEGQHAPTEGFAPRSQAGSTDKAPNPLTDPGAAAEFWHQKVSIVESLNEPPSVQDTDGADKQGGETNGDFERADESELCALAETESAKNIDDRENEKRLQQDDDQQQPKSTVDSGEHDRKDNPPTLRSKVERNNTVDPKDGEGMDNNEDSAEELMSDDGAASVTDSEEVHTEAEHNNIVVSNTDTIFSGDKLLKKRSVVPVDESEEVSALEGVEASERWATIQSETYILSRRLCESLRLVIEPLVSSKLRGDYRTGKRINMKRVISYIASGYRKDKIWLRRTKPAKRNYRILLAVDDSQSMLKGGAGEVALRAMATLATAMSQLEIGEVGVASFGNEMKLVHPFHSAFTSASGASVVRNFHFDQQRTRTALCIESALCAMEESSGDFAAMQLFFMISDGRIERDSRVAIRRLIREMVERNILLVLIIVEGNENNSITNMKEVSFEKGKPVVKRFMDDYPFPYYVIVNDMQTLPEVLADSLRQWFEILARLQGNQR